MTPEIAFLLVSDRMERVAGVLTALARQTIAARVELVLALPEGAAAPDAAAAGLGRVRVVRVADPFDVTAARAACIRAATATIVVIGETHCLPAPDCLERFAAAHSGKVVAVGPALMNANPATARSWAELLMDYGSSVHATEGGEVVDLPAHNASFRREALLAYGDRLEARLVADAGLARDLHARGGALILDPGARMFHLNISLTRPGLWERWYIGRAFAAERRAAWPRWRSVAYAASWPLVPVVRLARIVPEMRRIGVSARILPALLGSLVVSAVGETVGYLAGAGDANMVRRRMEIEKGSLLRSGEATDAVETVLAA